MCYFISYEIPARCTIRICINIHAVYVTPLFLNHAEFHTRNSTVFNQRHKQRERERLSRKQRKRRGMQEETAREEER